MPFPAPSSEPLPNLGFRRHPDDAVQQNHDQRVAIQERTDEDKTVLYLAYGSNMCAEKFREARGINPLSEMNVMVPELKLTFDMPGVPYLEPCFASTQFRDPERDEGKKKENGEGDAGGEVNGEKEKETDQLLDSDAKATKDAWNKPLVGVAYEVTMSDYAQIIATEGAGSAYEDIVVNCYPFEDDYTPDKPVPVHPDRDGPYMVKPFRAHCLMSIQTAIRVKKFEAAQQRKSEKINSEVEELEGRERWLAAMEKPLRPDPEYAQPSERYKKLLLKGAEEHALPYEYWEFLKSIPTYRTTSLRQLIGRFLYLWLVAPVWLGMLLLSVILSDENGHAPMWLVTVREVYGRALWEFYDLVAKRVFGDGERTIGR